MADGSKLRMEGRVQFTLRCGNYKERILARVFPDLHKEIILGIPWLEKPIPSSIGLSVVSEYFIGDAT